MGVTDSQEIVGVLEHGVEKLCKDISNLSNNPNKLDPVFLLQPSVIEVENKKIIYVIVPSSSQVHKTNNNYYDRSSDGDFIVKSHSKISELYSRKNTMFSENTIYPYLAEEHFDEGTVNKIYQLIRTYRPTHPWLEFTGLDFYKKAGLYRYDFNSGKSGFTLSALLLLGKEEAITSILPHYKIEALHYLYDNEQYNDRETIECNIITAYEKLMKFIAKHLPDKFYLEGDHRVSLRDNLFREIVANFLIHREYINPRVSRVEIRHDVVIFKNANKPHLYGSINVDSYESYPKNPHLAKFFVQIGRAEELGMGIKKIFKFCNLYSEQNPQIRDEDLFEVYIPITTTKDLEDTTPKGLEDTTPRGLEEAATRGLEGAATTKNLEGTTPKDLEGTTPRDEIRNTIIKLLSEDPYLSASKIGEKLRITRDGVNYHLKILKNNKQIKFEGKPQTGKWKILKKQL